ncbi:MAG TPA: TM0106 family RecB-like putative nuclease, partial [Casimicrobiaceae bacterium]|nr:TM0106 family RecB-like putative nuclease [Casimicrobiaceae bacterium]
REYLFGLARADNTYHKYWALTDDEERTAFEAIIDAILESWAAAPTMHVYHFAPYEPAALKRLMGRYATREAEIDRLLRAGLFVDIHTVVKQAMRASVEQYSLKDLEPFYSFARAVPLAEARTALRVTARALELDAPDAITREIRCTVEGYNRDDCVSAARLREWLEALRADAEKRGFWFARPGIATGDAPESVDERERKTQALRAALTADLPIEGRTSEQQARWLLANLLDFHRRESKAPWWEFFRLRDLSDDELFDERAAIAGLRFVERIPMKRSALHRYTYPAQDTDIRKDDELHSPDGDGFGRVGAIDRVGRLLDVKKSTKAAARDPSAVFAHTIVNTNVLADALARLAEDVLVHGIESDGDYAAAKQLLLAAPPRLRRAPFLMSDHESAVDFAVRVGSDLDRTVLAIQGPPGAGKTFTGARMIADLVARGLRVGVSAVSHKVIRTLLRGAVDAGRAAQVDVRCAHKINEVSDDADGIEEFKDNDDALKHLQAAYVVGGTAWLWARAEMRSAVDVLFIDEAGQMSLAQALASSQAATSVVLLGDPQQLDQPQRGSHPDGTDVAALEHMLGGSKTIARDRGIFLPETWRLAPAICGFTSELFYEGRLRARTGLERQALVGTDGMDGAGLWLLPVDHTGNRNSSTEEVDAIEHFLSSLVRPSACWIDADGKTHALTVADLLIVAPYNAHVALLEERFAARNIRVGTVDKFQGQEAPVIIYSMATSTPEDAPRGMEFLYSLHRLNVASSRARCACIVVASPRLFEPECKTPRQMQLANALCRYVECARTITL